MNKVIHSVTLLVLAVSLIASENNTHELPTLSGYSPSVAVLLEENINNGYDQCRTFAATGFYQNGNHRFLMNYDMLTSWIILSESNGDKQYFSHRTDRIDAIYSYKAFSNDNLYVRVGGGGRFYGDLGGARLQDRTHKIIGSTSLNDEYPGNDPFAYDDSTGLAALGQVTIGAITPSVALISGFANINADVTTQKEVCYHGFAGIAINKAVYLGMYVNAERNPYSDTVKAYRNTDLDEDTYGVRLAICLKNVYGDFSLGATRSHFRLGFSF